GIGNGRHLHDGNEGMNRKRTIWRNASTGMIVDNPKNYRGSGSQQFLVFFVVFLGLAALCVFDVWAESGAAKIRGMLAPFDPRLTTTGLEWVRIQEIWSAYDVSHWVYDGDIRTSGRPQDARHWPDLNFAPWELRRYRRAGERR